MKKILVVDNDPIMVRFMRGLLTKEGYEVLTAGDGLSALEILETYIPDLIFVDLVMPNISGDRLCRAIRRIPPLSNTFIVILSAIAAEEETDFRGCGADACIAKGPLNKMAEQVIGVIGMSDLDRTDHPSGKIVGLERVQKRGITSELLASKRHLEAVLGNVREGIVELNSKGQIIYANPFAAALLGASEETLLAVPFEGLFPTAGREHLRSLLRNRDQGSESGTQAGPISLNHRDVLLRVFPIEEPTRESLGVILSDVTERNRTEEALRLTQFAVDHASEAAFWMETDARFAYVNEAACRSLGYSREELLKMTVHDIDSEFPKEKWSEHWGEIKRRGSFSFESQHRTKDGRVFPVEVTVNYLEFSGKAYNCAFVRDISDRKKMLEALHKTQKELETIIDSVPALIAFKDGNNRYVRINKTYSDFVELPKECIEGRSVFDITRNRQLAEGYWQDDKEVMTSGIPKRNIIEPLVFDETVTIQTDKIPYHDEKGDIVGVIAFCLDITSRVQAERALKESENRYRKLVESSSDAILMMDAERRILSCNKAFLNLFGYKKSEIAGESIRVIHRSDESFHSFGEAAYPEIAKTGKYRTEWDFVSKDGSVRPVESITSKITSVDGMTTGYVAVMRDITDRKRAEEAERRVQEELERRVQERTLELEEARKAAEAANDAKTEFLANMSHELRTPLNHIIGFTELVVDKSIGELNDTQAEYLNDALESSRHLLSLINDILDLSKVEAGKLSHEPSEVPLKTLLENCLMMIKEKALLRHIKLSLATDANLPETVSADERGLKQIMYNLLSNAAKFTPDGGAIGVSAKRVRGAALQGPTPRKLNGKEFVEISVADTGIGVNRENLERIFKSFEQVDNSVSRKHHGTGLGLSLSKNLVELHGGRIWAESEGEGKGAVFRFILPLID